MVRAADGSLSMTAFESAGVVDGFREITVAVFASIIKHRRVRPRLAKGRTLNYDLLCRQAG